MGTGAIVVIVAVVGALVAVKLAGGGSAGPPREPLPVAALTKLTTVPLSTLLGANTKQLTSPEGISGAPLTSTSGSPGQGGGTTGAGNGSATPEMLFIGAEFCPVCATERWPMILALSHFGTFSNVSQTHSAVRDGDIPTLSFYGSTFTSKYLVFTSVETTTNQPSGNYYKLLQSPTAAQNALWAAHSPPKGETFPFIDIGGKWLLQTSQYDPTTLEGHSFDTILDSVGSNHTTIGNDIDGSALLLIQDICDVTGQQPAATCQAAGSASGSSSTSGNGPSSPAS
jgi:Domain of unknown function (DUF929)